MATTPRGEGTSESRCQCSARCRLSPIRPHCRNGSYEQQRRALRFDLAPLVRALPEPPGAGGLGASVAPADLAVKAGHLASKEALERRGRKRGGSTC